MSENPPDSAALIRFLEGLQKSEPTQVSPGDVWELALRHKIPGTIPPVKWTEQFKKDYLEYTQIPLHRVYTSPIDDEPEEEPLLREQIIVEMTKGRLARCYWNNPKLEHPDPDTYLILDQPLVCKIRPATTQVWRAHLSVSGRAVVAKFFDPLYFIDEEEHLDPLKLAVRDVSKECQAYKRLESMQRVGIPEFLGLFLAAFTPPDQDSVAKRPFSRNVYVILTEDIIGETLDHVDPFNASPNTRGAIMDSIIELDNQARALGVVHQDLDPRNAILRTSEGAGANPVVVMVDFADVELLGSFPIAWDGSEAARKERLANARNHSYMVSHYPAWVERGWFLPDSPSV